MTFYIIFTDFGYSETPRVDQGGVLEFPPLCNSWHTRMAGITQQLNMFILM